MALGLAESAAPAPVDSALLRAAAALAAVLSVPLLAMVFAAVTVDRLQRWPQARTATLAKYDRLRLVQNIWWLCVVAATVGGLGWARLVRFNAALADTILIDDCLILAAAIVPWLLSLWGAYEVDRALTGSTVWGGAHDALPTLSKYIRLHARQQLGLVLAPLLAMLAVQDMARRFAPEWLEGPRAWLLFLAPLAALLAAFPLLLQLLWKTEPLPAGPLRQRLVALGQRTGFQPREILIWHTEQRVVNAAVSGILPGLRYVLLSDGLLASLSDEDVEAIYAHEIGHVQCRHLTLRALAMLAPLGLWLVVQPLLTDVSTNVLAWLASRGIDPEPLTGVAVALGVAAYVGLVFGRYSRRLEYQADLFACRSLATAGTCEPSGELRFTRAMERLARAGGIDPTQGSWQHDSIARRVDLVARAAANPAWTAKFERRLAWQAQGLTVICFIGLASQVARLF